jgi:phage terminase large subunit-like protein
LAGITLYLLIADDEEGAEIFGCALDRDQARKVFDVAERMVQLSPVLRKRLKIYAQVKRIVDQRSASFYEIVAADAAGNLGHNPHGVVVDELNTQKDGKLWSAMRTAMGSRLQPLMVAALTAGDDDRSFAAAEHKEMEKVAEDPERAPHILAYIRNTPRAADPWDEKNWYHANPALGSFLSIQALRDEAIEARNDPAKENAFRQFRLNQWVSQSHRWMPMHLWHASMGNLWLNPVDGRRELAGRTAYAGLDLAAKFDLCAWCLLLPGDTDQDPVDVLWRFWLPESGVERLDKAHDGQFTRWAQQGWLTVTDGSVLDYDRVIADITADGEHFRIAALDADEWSMWPVINRVAAACGLDEASGAVTAYRNTYDRMNAGMDQIMALVQDGRLHHHGNPLARFCFDSCEARRATHDVNLRRPDKPDRSTSRARIDAVPTAVMAANAWRAAVDNAHLGSAYEDHSLYVV